MLPLMGGSWKLPAVLGHASLLGPCMCVEDHNGTYLSGPQSVYTPQVR